MPINKSFFPSLGTFEVITGILLFLAPLSWPYAYYQALRWTVTILSLKTAYGLPTEKKQLLPIWISIAVLYNPISPIHMDKDVWVLFNVGIGIFILTQASHKKRHLS